MKNWPWCEKSDRLKCLLAMVRVVFQFHVDKNWLFFVFEVEKQLPSLYPDQMKRGWKSIPKLILPK